ncbi:MAG: hypothetical protein [Olavius algarvensis Delta 4 endosymbiont]|nr:MAG: hypothetical protein [Olavius algarvensis Delta 4 endosymbiont]
MKTCFGWPDASPNALIAFGKKFVFSVLVQLTSDHRLLTSGPLVADENIFNFTRN